MKIDPNWQLTPKEAIIEQKKLAQYVEPNNRFETISLIAGIDMSVRQEVGHAAIVVFRFPELTIAEYATVSQPLTFPYIPGLFSFREGPVVMQALTKLKTTPDLLMFDSQGIAHPRRFGLACHVGVLTDLPSIGCAKSRLCGTYQDPDLAAGSSSLLWDNAETIGAVVRTRSKVKPVFVSIGHRIDLETSIRYILATTRGYRLPEPTRWAHHVSKGKVPPQVND